MGQRKDRGAVTIVLALFFLIFVLLLAFVVDFGRTYTTRAKLQNAADAAALAAASAVTTSTSINGRCDSFVNPANTSVQYRACNYALSNSVPNNSAYVYVPPLTPVSPGPTRQVQVDAEEFVPFIFGKLVGRDGVMVRAGAVATPALAPGAPYGFFVGINGTIKGGGSTGFTVSGSPAFIGGPVTLNGQADHFLFEGGLYSSSAQSESFTVGTPPSTTTATTTQIDSQLAGITTPAQYGDLIGLKDLAGFTPTPLPSSYYIDTIQSEATTANGEKRVLTVTAGSGSNPDYCSLDLSTIASTTRWIYCSAMIKYTGTSPATSQTKLLIQGDGGFDTAGNTTPNIGTWDTAAQKCSVTAVLYSPTGSLVNKGGSTPAVNLCGSIFLPTGSIDTGGKGINVKGGRVVVQNVAENGNSGNYNVLPAGDVVVQEVGAQLLQ